MKHPGIDMTGTYVVLRSDLMNPDYRSIDWRVVLITGGFGAKPGLSGSAIFAQHFDGEDVRYDINDFDRLATVTEIHRFAHHWDSAHELDSRCVMGSECEVVA